MQAAALAESLRRATRALDVPPADEPWNLHELEGLLSPGDPRPAAVLVGVITLLVPQVQAIRDELLILIVTVSLALIGGFSLDEAARIGKERAGQNEEQLRELIKELLTELFEEMMHEEKEEPHV